MATKRNKAWFFSTVGDTKIGQFWQRFIGGGVSKPTQATFEDLLESVPVFDESSSAASVDSAAALKDKQGLVIVQTDAKAKTNDNTIVGSLGTAVARPSHLPTIAESRINTGGSLTDVDSSDVALGGTTIATLLTAGLDVGAASSLKTTIDTDITTRNKYFIRLSNYYLNFLAALVSRLLPVGGTTNQVLSKINATNYNVQWSNVDLYRCTSVSSIALTQGTKAFTVPTGMAYAVGLHLKIVDSANASNFMEGVVAAYSGTTLQFNPYFIRGSGTIASWNINLGTGDLFRSMSSTSNLIGTGSKTFTVGNDLAYQIGNRIRFTSAASSANYMEGVVTSYNNLDVAVTIDITGGVGTLSDWIVGPGSGTAPAAAPVTLTKIVNIGAWDMTMTAGGTTILVPHGVADFTKIRRVSVLVINDAGTQLTPLEFFFGAGPDPGSKYWVTTTDIELFKATVGGYFDSTDFNATTGNRGWITIEYIA